jgi:hypothetical protein
MTALGFNKGGAVGVRKFAKGSPGGVGGTTQTGTQGKEKDPLIAKIQDLIQSITKLKATIGAPKADKAKNDLEEIIGKLGLGTSSNEQATSEVKNIVQIIKAAMPPKKNQAASLENVQAASASISQKSEAESAAREAESTPRVREQNNEERLGSLKEKLEKEAKEQGKDFLTYLKEQRAALEGAPSAATTPAAPSAPEETPVSPTSAGSSSGGTKISSEIGTQINQEFVYDTSELDSFMAAITSGTSTFEDVINGLESVANGADDEAAAQAKSLQERLKADRDYIVGVRSGGPSAAPYKPGEAKPVGAEEQRAKLYEKAKEQYSTENPPAEDIVREINEAFTKLKSEGKSDEDAKSGAVRSVAQRRAESEGRTNANEEDKKKVVADYKAAIAARKAERSADVGTPEKPLWTKEEMADHAREDDERRASRSSSSTPSSSVGDSSIEPIISSDIGNIINQEFEYTSAALDVFIQQITSGTASFKDVIGGLEALASGGGEAGDEAKALAERLKQDKAYLVGAADAPAQAPATDEGSGRFTGGETARAQAYETARAETSRGSSGSTSSGSSSGGPTAEDLDALISKETKDRNAYNDNQFFEYKARKEGVTAKGYKQNIARQLGKAAYEVTDNYKGRSQEMSYELAGRQESIASIGSTIEAAKQKSKTGTDEEKAVARQQLSDAQSRLAIEAENIAKSMRDLNPSLDMGKVQDASKEIADLLSSGQLKEAQDKLVETLGKAPEGPEAMKIAMDQLAKQLGISRDILERNFGEGGLEAKEVKRQQFVQSREGQRFGALAEYAPDMLSKFSGTGAGKALGSGADFISGKGGKFSQLFSKMGGLATVGATLSVAAEKFKNSVTVTNANTAGIVGGIGGAGSGLASGAVLGAQVAGPIGALIAGVSGAIIGGITGAFDAFNSKRLENNIKLVETSASDLNVALKKLAENASDTNAALVNTQSTKLLQDSGDLREQANLGRGGMARSAVEFLRAYDFTGISNSVTGGTVEKEARDAFVGQTLVPYVDAQSSLGDLRRNKISTEQLQEVRTRIDNRSKAAAATKDPAQIAAAEKLNREELLKSSQTVRQLIAPESEGGKGHSLDEALITMGMTQRKKEGRDYEVDSKTAEGKAKLREEGAKLAAQEEDSKNKTLLLSRAMREMSIETDHLIETYRRAGAYITRFGDELEAFDAQLNNNISALRGQASVGPVDRRDEKILGNLSGYSDDEVKGAADRVAQLAGGGPAGIELGQQVQMNKVLQDKLPQILKGATAGNINEGDNSVMSQIKEALSVVGEPPKALLDEIEANLRDKTAGRAGGTSLSDVGDNTSGFINSLKGAQAATNLSIALEKQYNDALQKTIGYTNEYAKALQEAADYQMQAQDVRLKGEIQLKETLGQRMSLDEVNAPQETRIKSLTKGGTLDPGTILRDMNDDMKSKKANEDELAKRAMKASETGAQPDIAAFEEQATLVAKQNNSINNSRKALEELAKDSSGASNALKGLAEQQKASRASVNFLQKVFTSDAGQLQEMNKGLAAYTKVISGKASGKEMNNLQFRQQAFSGLESISGMMPDSVKNQMQAKLIKNMAGASPQLTQMLNQKTGYTYTDKAGNVKEATFMDSLNEAETGTSKAQEEYINAYKEATSRQADAADKLGIAAMSVANTFANGMTGVLEKIQTQLIPSVDKATTDTKVENKPPAPLDINPALVYSVDPKSIQDMKDALNIKNIPLIWPAGADTSVNALTANIAALTTAVTLLAGAVVGLGLLGAFKNIPGLNRIPGFGKTAAKVVAGGADDAAKAAAKAGAGGADDAAKAAAKAAAGGADDAARAAGATDDAARAVGGVDDVARAAATEAATEAATAAATGVDDVARAGASATTATTTAAGSVDDIARAAATEAATAAATSVDDVARTGASATTAAGSVDDIARAAATEAATAAATTGDDVVKAGAAAVGTVDEATKIGSLATKLAPVARVLAGLGLAADVIIGGYTGATSQSEQANANKENFGQTAGTVYNTAMGSLTGSAETGRSYAGYFAGIDPDSTQYSTTGAYAGRAFGNVTSLLEAGGRGALAGSAIPGGALVGGTVGVAAETAKMTVELGRQTAGLYNDRAVAAEGAAKTDKMLEASKSTNTYGLDFTELSRAKDEASVRVKLGKAKAGGDSTEEARLQKELESLKSIRVKDREKDDYFSGYGGDSKEFTTAVTEMVAQQQEADKALQTPASAKEKTKIEEGAAGLASESKPIYMKVLEDILTAIKPSSTDSTTDTASIDTSIEDVSAVNAAEVLPKVIEETEAAAAVSAITESQPTDSLQTDSKPIYMKVLEDILGSLVRPQEKQTITDQTTQPSALKKLDGTSSTQGGLPAEIMSLMDQKNLSTSERDTMAKLYEQISANIPAGMASSAGGAFSIPPEIAKGLNGIAGKGSDITASAMDLFKRAKTGGAGDLSSMISSIAPQADIEQYIRSSLGLLANPQPTTTDGPEAQKAYEQQVAMLEEKIGQIEKRAVPLRTSVAQGFEQDKLELTKAESEKERIRGVITEIPKPGPLTTTPVSPEKQAFAEEAKALLQKMQITGGSSPAVLQAAVQGINQNKTTAPTTTTGTAVFGPVAPASAMGPALPPANNRIDKFIANAQASQLEAAPSNTPTSPSQPVAPAAPLTPADLKAKKVASLKALQAAHAKLSGLGKDGASFTDEDSAALEADVVSKDQEYKSATKAYGESQLSPANKASRERNKLRANKEAAKKKLFAAQESQTNNMASSLSGSSGNGMTDFGLVDTSKVASAQKEYQSSVDALKSAPEKTLNPVQQAYQSQQQSRRQAYLSRFRPEVRERLMTKGEKAERDLAQARATQMAEKPPETPGINGPTSTLSQQVSGDDFIDRDRPISSGMTQAIRPASGPIPTSVPASQISQQQAAAAPASQGGGQNQGGPSPSYSITLDEASKQFLSEFSNSLNNFGSYIDQLSKIHIPDKIEMSHKGVVEVRVSGAAAFSAIEEKMQKAINDAVSQKMEKIWNQSGGQLGDSPSMPVSKAAGQA